jgi:hypothetical protein
MRKYVLLLLLAATFLTASGCANHPGSREYSPDTGWVPN